MSMAIQRFQQLKQKFHSAVPGRKLSPAQQRAIISAANLQQSRRNDGRRNGDRRPARSADGRDNAK
jgi:hypothetical protein